MARLSPYLALMFACSASDELSTRSLALSGSGSDAGAGSDAYVLVGVGSDAAASDATAHDAAPAEDAEESIYEPPREHTAVHPGALDIALAGTTPAWFPGVLVDPTGVTRAIDSQLAFTSVDRYTRARELYEQYGIYVPSMNEAHASWLHDRVDTTCSAYCYLVVEPLNAPNALPVEESKIIGQTYPNPACSHPLDNDQTRDSFLEEDKAKSFVDLWLCNNSNQSNYRANVSVRCDYSRACATTTIGCSFKYDQIISGLLYSFAWRRHNVKQDSIKPYTPYEARALARLEASLYGPLAGDTWQKQDIATETVAHSKTEPTDADKVKDESPLAALTEIKLEYQPEVDPIFKVSGVGVALIKVAARLYQRWRVEEKGSLHQESELIKSGFANYPFTIAPNQPAATYTFSLGQIKLKTDRVVKTSSFQDAYRKHDARATSRAWAWIHTRITEPKLNPIPPADSLPPKRCMVGLAGVGAEFVVTSGLKREYTQAEKDSANHYCSAWAIDHVKTNRLEACQRLKFDDQCGGRYLGIKGVPDPTPHIPPAELCVSYCKTWLEACCFSYPKPDGC